MERGLAHPRTGAEERIEAGSPEAAAARERAAVLEAMVDAVAELGFAGVRLEGVAERAGVSAAAINAHFADEAECFMAAYGMVVGRVRAQLREHEVEGEWPEQIRAGVRALTDLFMAEPGLARMGLVEVAGVGPEAMLLYREALELLHPALERGRKYAEHGDELPEGIATMAIGAAITLLVEEAQYPRLEPERLRRELVFATLLPFLGPEEAQREAAAG